MTDEELMDTPTHTEDDGSDSDSSDKEEQVEWLATGREKRATAGNRLSILMQQEEDDDELELLFAEDEDDIGFEESEGDASDVQMDSSDDDEDQGPAAGAEELEGEKELERQVRVERMKKRKANDGIPKLFRKRVKIDPTVPQKTPPRPKKKSERASWIPTAAEAPTRASARRTTKKSKEQLYRQMLDREKKRLRQLTNMEEAAKRRGTEKPKERTQEDRLAEAARVEKMNAKSLNRWEEAEKIREEEQRAKLAALNSRKMHGPVITWWSGLTEWVNGKLKHIGKNVTIEEKEKPAPRKKKAEIEAGEAAKASADGAPAPTDANVEKTVTSLTSEAKTDVPAPSKEVDEAAEKPAPSQEIKKIEVLPSKKADGADTEEKASSPQEPRGIEVGPSEKAAEERTRESKESSGPKSPVEAPAEAPVDAPAKPSVEAPAEAPIEPPLQEAQFDGSAPLPGFSTLRQANSTPDSARASAQPAPRLMPSATTPFTFDPPPAAEGSTIDETPTVERETRNCIVFENFDETAMKQKDTSVQILFGRTFSKISKPPQVPCAITNRPARFRDPASGLPYLNAFAYREIQNLKRGDYRWSALLQAYVGQAKAARGVPGRFVHGGGSGGVGGAKLGR
ncbi:MAG: hypothetical protein M1818_003739 [Claussenomyces sp. TS43310]|nr:MAG: hypothetical protein M1818_003739 [Claussenomyces sp. TS43310]